MFYFSDVPTLQELLWFEPIHIIERIGANALNLGTLLLNDHTGSIMPAIEQQCHGNVAEMNIQIFMRWLRGEGIEDRSWGRLLHVLRNVNCKALAEEIEEILLTHRPASQVPGTYIHITLVTTVMYTLCML